MDEYGHVRMESVKRFYPQAKEIIRELSPYMTEVCDASLDEDMLRATDMNLVLVGSSLGNRCIGESFYDKYHACIFRSRAEGDSRPSEITRIMTLDDPRWYFYSWHDELQITKWLLLDVDAIRRSEVLTKYKPKPFNHGANYFVEVSILEMAYIGAIVTCNKPIMDYIFSEATV